MKASKYSSLWKLILCFILVNIVFLSIFHSKISFSTETCRQRKDSFETVTISTGNHNVQPYNDCPSYNPQITVKDLFQYYFQSFNNSAWLAQPSIYSISFNELHSLLYGSQTKNIYKSWPNYHKKVFDGSYPHTSMTTDLFLIIAAKINISIHLVVEVGSFIGKSSSNIGRAIQIHPQWSKQVVLLCIDTWLGGVEHWLQYRHMSALEYGRPTIFEQFLANIIHANLTNIVLPLSTTSLIGAQLLIRHKLFPQLIYLDSAHLQGETLVEIEMFWVLLQPGGILIGDDWRWRSVRCDVLRFARSINVVPTVIRNTWFIQK
ncbi:unnamed protein product [Adineta ricciae]|uniref:Uncharacterized protein n=1 Tax=Adineta ricciae TaxID=249248 RepID=A0A816ANF9_ADIRI|nr:unnamed protein product [Adineta ricciae]